MRGTTVIATCTFLALALSGCAGEATDQGAAPVNPGSAATDANSAGSTGPDSTGPDFTGLDEGTAAACTVAEKAVLGSEGHDLDVSSAKAIVAAARTSKSSLLTTQAAALQYGVSRAEAAAGNPDEAGMVAEVTAAILKFRTVCQDTDALAASVQAPATGGSGASAPVNEPTDRSGG